MRRNRRLVLGLAFLLCALGSAPQSSAEEIDPAFRADIVRLMEVTGSAEVGEQMASLISGQILDGFKKTHPRVSPRAFDIAKEVLVAEFATAFKGPEGLFAKLIPLHAKYFSQEDVRGLLAFYETELGRKMIAVMPALMQESAQVGQAWAEEMMPRVDKVLKERLEAEGLLEE